VTLTDRFLAIGRRPSRRDSASRVGRGSPALVCTRALLGPSRAKRRPDEAWRCASRANVWYGGEQAGLEDRRAIGRPARHRQDWEADRNLARSGRRQHAVCRPRRLISRWPIFEWIGHRTATGASPPTTALDRGHAWVMVRPGRIVEFQ
jgi:hypothetical protein